MKKCKIIIKDEVNIKLDGLDPSTRRKCSDKLKFFLPHAFHTPAYKLGRWDGMVRFCDVGGRTYLNLLDDLVPIIVDAGYEFEIQDERMDHGTLEFDHVAEDYWGDKTWPKGHKHEGELIRLRDYQVEIINKFIENPQALQEVATGAGKTIMTATMASIVERYGRSIVIVPNKDLVKQTAKDYENCGLDYGVYFGDKKDIGKTHTVCTWQSLNSLLKQTKEGKADVDEFVKDVICVIVDECFDGETPVLTPTGYVPIKDIKSGDTVINLNEQTGEFKEDTVVEVYENLTKSSSEKMYELEFDNGNIIKVTGNHKFLTEQHGWVRADELTADMEIKHKYI